MDTNWSNILWVAIVVVVIIIIYNNFCNKQNMENFSNFAQSMNLQSNLIEKNQMLNNNLKKIIDNDKNINKNISYLNKQRENLKEQYEAFKIPNLPKCSYSKINGANDDGMKYAIKMNNTTNMVPNIQMPACPNMPNNNYNSCLPQGSNMCTQGVEMKPYGYSFGDNQQEDNEFLNWVSENQQSPSMSQ